MTGQTISHYKILEKLGRGGMGEVYKAEDLKLKRTVALKFLPLAQITDKRSKQLLLEEARATAAINHPHIATVYELGQTGSLSYLVMEYVEGETLSRQIERGLLEIKISIEIAICVVEALQCAHAHGLIHCDIKSANILLTSNGNVKVADFGLARRAQRPGQAAVNRTVDTILSPGHSETASHREEIDFPQNGINGTVSYMSPEQIRGEPLDARTDIFSFGVVLYEMITGRQPFTGKDPAAVLQAILNDEPMPLGAYRDDVPLELESIVRKSLQKNRDERYQSAEALLSDLNRLINQLEPVGAEEKSSTITPSPESFGGVLPAKLQFISAFFQRYRKWLLPVAVIAALAAGVNILIGQPQGKAWIGIAGLFLISAVCFIGYFVPRRRFARAVSSLPQGAAFRGLLPFQESDRERFYGREIETAKLFEMIAHNEFHFGVLFGDSGSGKTSLLRAGLLPRLWKEGYIPIYCRSYKNPLTALMEECRKRSQLSPREDESPVDYLRRVAAELSAGLVMICDQFEELFINFKTRQEREPFISFVTACYHATNLPVKFLFCLRSDFLYLINSEFASRIPEPLLSSRLFHLRNFDRQQAEDIIVRSARAANLPFAANLIRKVARDLATNDMVLPSELQIVCEQLQNKRVYTLQEYLRAGGKELLVLSFLEDVIQASGEKETAHLLLRSLISEENTKLALTPEDIARRIQRSPETVERLLNLFVPSRLIREIQEEQPWRYELMHEYLIEKINQITGKVMTATQRANRLFRQYLSNYTIDKRTRISIRDLWRIKRYADLDWGQQERELLRKSLRWGLLKIGATSLFSVSVAILMAAALSIHETWESVQLSDGHAAGVRTAAFSPDGRLLVSGGDDGKVIVWDFARRERLATLADHRSRINTVAFSPDGKWLATGSADSTILIWDAKNFNKAAVLPGHQGQIECLAFSTDGRLLASGGDDGWIKLWQVGRWETLRQIPFPTRHWYFLFIANGRRLILQDGQMWDLATGQAMTAPWDSELTGNASAISPDEKQLVTLSGDGSVFFLDAEKRRLSGRQRGHRDHGSSVVFSPDGRLVATGAENIVLWDAVTQNKVARFDHAANVGTLAFAPDGRWLVSGHNDGALLLWDIAERERVANFNEHGGSVRTLAFSPDGQLVASAGDDRSIIIWNLTNNTKQTVLVGHDNIVKGVAFSPDGKWVASTDQDATIICWELETRRPRWTFKFPEHAHSYDLAISPDGNWIATTTGVYESSAGRQVVNFLANGTDLGSLFGVAFSSDGKWLASVSTPGKFFIWDVATWQRVDSLNVAEISLKNVRFSPDGKRLVTGESQGVVRLWESDPLRQIAMLGRHTARIRSVAFSPVGRQVASAGDDQTIALWDVRKRRLVTHIGVHTSPVNAIAFSTDGKFLAAGEHDKSVRIYTRQRTLWGKRLD